MGVVAAPLVERIACAQRLGDRARQEDNFLVTELSQLAGGDDDRVLLVLADGMGGHSGGATASQLAVKAFADAFIAGQSGEDTRARMLEGLEAATQAISAHVAENPERKGMGCTLVGVLVHRDRLEWISVGDSPLWIVRNGALVRLNADHSLKPMLDELVEKGEMTAAQAEADHRRGMLRSAVDGEWPELHDLQVDGYAVQPDDVLLLASDGMETLSERDILNQLEATSDLAVTDQLQRLLDRVIAEAEPHQDNVTGILMAAHVSAAGRTKLDVQTLRVGQQAQAAAPVQGSAPKPAFQLKQRDRSFWLGLAMLGGGVSIALVLIAALLWGPAEKSATPREAGAAANAAFVGESSSVTQGDQEAQADNSEHEAGQ